MSRMAELWEEFLCNKSIETIGLPIEDELKVTRHLKVRNRLLNVKLNPEICPNVYKEYHDYINDLATEEEKKIQSVIRDVHQDVLAEYHRCKAYGIPCSYGICSECDDYYRDILGLRK